MVHPHACGERKFMGDQFSPYDGSSPRMWGTQFAPIKWTEEMRFIPTHVGNATRLQWQTVN